MFSKDDSIVHLPIEYEIDGKKLAVFFLDVSQLFHLYTTHRWDMKFYKTSEYAIKVLIFLGAHHGEIYSVKTLNETLNVPYKYLGRLMPRLSNAGFINVIKGRNGGYRMDKKQCSVHLYEILDSVEGLENYERCILGYEKCSNKKPCPIHKYWGEIRNTVNKKLLTLTIKDIIKDQPLNI